MQVKNKLGKLTYHKKLQIELKLARYLYNPNTDSFDNYYDRPEIVDTIADILLRNNALTFIKLK